MANGRGKGCKTAAADRDGGYFTLVPNSALLCPAYGSLNHMSRSLLWELALQRRSDNTNNGQLLASRAYLKKRGGWSSNESIQRAKDELLAAGFIYETVKGHRPNKASWYALTCFALARHPGYDFGATENFVRSAYKKFKPEP